MFSKSLKNAVASCACLLLSAGVTSTAQADLIFTTSGSTSGGPVAGTADFKVIGSTLELILENTTGSVGAIAQVLDGLSFTLGGTSIVGLASVTPNSDGSNAHSFEFCDSTGCTGSDSFQSLAPTCSDTASPYCWLFAAGLLAPQGFKPGGIVNSSVNNADGIKNAQHNDYLNGPVKFVFDLTEPPDQLDVSDVTFWWGTGRETTTGGGGCSQEPCVLLQQAPEPGSLALLGLALSGLAWTRRRFKA